jgi:CxxC motif-containing protein (DUF1111 family)
MATLSINRIEDELAERGIETNFTGTDDYTSFIIGVGSAREIELLDAVSGDSFRAENLTEAILYGAETENVTDTFEGVESVEEFLTAVAELLGR